MLKRYVPQEDTDGVNVRFTLPEDYYKGDITLFVNGQLLPTRDDTEHFYGYILNESEGYFEFYEPPEEDDYLYIIYESTADLNFFENVDWNKKVKKIEFAPKTNKILWNMKPVKVQWVNEIQKKSWDMTSNTVEFDLKPKKIEFNYKIYDI
jgi:hypothetical protein